MEELKEYLDYLRVQRNLSPATLAVTKGLNPLSDFAWEQLDFWTDPRGCRSGQVPVGIYLAYLAREG